MSLSWSELLSGPRIGKFASVGAVGAVVDLTVATGLLFAIDLRPELAKLVGAECAIIVMFVLNDRWTFPNAGRDSPWARLKRLGKSNLVRSGGIAVQVAVVWVLTGLPVSVPLFGRDIWPAVTMPIAIGTAATVNYVAESLFTWRIGR